MEAIPVIDVSGLRGEATARRAVAAELGRACREAGFFYVVRHGVSPGVRTNVFAAAHRLFALPAAAKEQMSCRLSAHNRGYVGFGGERLDGSAADQKEAFNVGLELPADDPEVVAGDPYRGANLWPELPGWREAVLTYFDACETLQRDIHRGFALDLGIDEMFFADKLERADSILRLLHYQGDPSAQPGELSAGTHTDYGNLTILATDGVAGLQVRRRDGGWIDAPYVAGALLCNIADCLMRWTNDVYVSTPHHVLVPRTDRYSIAFFGDANPYARVEAIPTCVPAGAAAKYPPTTSGEYIRSRLKATYDHLKDAAA